MDIFHLYVFRSGLEAQYKILSSAQILISTATEQAEGKRRFKKFLKQLPQYKILSSAQILISRATEQAERNKKI